MQIKNITLLGLLFVVITIMSCNKNKFEIDISHIDADLEIIRFDKELFSVPVDSLKNFVPVLDKKHNEFLDIFGNQIINIGGTNNALFTGLLEQFVNDYNIKQVKQDVYNEFSDMSEIEGQLQNGFKHYKFYFPEKTIPKVYTSITGFNQSIIISDSILGIGLDKYLGKSYKFYNKMQIPMYMQVNMEKEFIVSDCFRAVAIAEFPFYDSITNLSTMMIYEGKVQYFLDAILPYTPDSIKLRYTSKQLNWLNKSEESMWEFLIDKKLLFSTDFMEIKRFTGEAPFTAAFSNESPARTGNWLGYKIVCAYMKKNPEITLKDLMNEKDYHKILNQSKYNP